VLQALIGQHVGPWTDELARLTCPACGIGYMEFAPLAVWAVLMTTMSSVPVWNRCSTGFIARSATSANAPTSREPRKTG